MTAASRAGLALALVAVTPSARADPSRGVLPREPWTQIDVIPTPGNGGIAPLVLPDGRIAVFTRGPSTLSLVDPRSGNVRSNRLEEQPNAEFRPRIDARGRLVFQGEGRTLFRLGVDGQVRVAATMPGMLHRLIEGADGTEIAAFGSDNVTEFATLRSDGSVAAVRSVATHGGESSGTDGLSSEPVRLEDGRVAVCVARGLAVYDRSGAIELVPGVNERRFLMNVQGAALAVTTTAIYPLDRHGVEGTPRPLPGPVAWWEPQPNGSVLGWVGGPAPRLLTVARDGSVSAPLAVPANTAAVTVAVDESGAVLLASAQGLLTVLEADGRTRWQSSVSRTIARPVLLVGGEAWITAADGHLYHLHNRHPETQEPPRADR